MWSPLANGVCIITRGVYSYFTMHRKNRITVTAQRSARHVPLNSDAWTWRVGLGIAVPLLALLLRTDESGSVSFLFLPDHSLPTICAFRRSFEMDCLGCGLTRSIILLLHGRLSESITTHGLGWLVLLLIVLQIPYGIQVRYRRKAWRPSQRTSALFWAGIFAVFVIVRLWT